MSRTSKAKAKGNRAKSKLKKAKTHAKNFSKINDPRRYVPHTMKRIRQYKHRPSKIA